MPRHSLAEERSLALHRVIAERLRSDPRIVDRARARVLRWAERHEAHRYYIDAWLEVLSRSPEELATFLVDRSEHARMLRQMTPFAGAIDARERWQILRAVAS